MCMIICFTGDGLEKKVLDHIDNIDLAVRGSEIPSHFHCVTHLEIVTSPTCHVFHNQNADFAVSARRYFLILCT